VDDVGAESPDDARKAEEAQRKGAPRSGEDPHRNVLGDESGLQRPAAEEGDHDDIVASGQQSLGQDEQLAFRPTGLQARDDECQSHPLSRPAFRIARSLTLNLPQDLRSPT
jgi:hypothetical protein